MSFKIIEHELDVLVIGAGGSALRAALGSAENDLKVACVSKVYPTRSHTIAAQGGIAASLGSLDEDKWQWHMYDTVKGSDWLGDQDVIEYMCKNANKAVYELEKYGVPFSRTKDGKIYQRPFGGHTKNNGKEPVTRACAAADMTGHAMLHTLFQQCLKHKVKFFSEHYVTDLLFNEEDKCVGAISLELDTGYIHVFNSHFVVLATGGGNRVYFSTTQAHTCTGDGYAMAARAGIPLQDMEFVQFHPTGLYGSGCLITEGARGEGAYFTNSKGERFMEKYAPSVKDLASRDVCSRAISVEILEGRGLGEHKDHIYLNLHHIDSKLLHQKLPGIIETSKVFAGVDLTKEPVPIIPTAHYNMGGVPANYKGQVVKLSQSGAEVEVEGLMAVGENACLSVHGANRLGANSLLELVVFGKAVADHIANSLKNKKSLCKVPKSALDKALTRLNDVINRKGDTSAKELRENMQRTMQKCASVFRTQELLEEGANKISNLQKELSSVELKDKDLIWNTNLVDILELENLLTSARSIVTSALYRRESRGAHSREDYKERDDENYLFHTLVHNAHLDKEVEYEKRPVHTYTLTDEIEYIKPQKRVY